MPKLCPFNKLKPCVQSDCELWLEFAVAQRGEPNNVPGTMRGGCAVTWGPILQYDANFKLLGTQQAVEGLRNETVTRYEQGLTIQRAMLAASAAGALEHDDDPH